MKKKDVISKNYLDKIPIRPDEINWSKDDEGMVTLDIENKGFFNMLAQKFFHKPRISHIHLDKMGSFVWPHIDGETDISGLGLLVKEEPLAIDLGLTVVSKRNSVMRPIRCMNVW